MRSESPSENTMSTLQKFLSSYGGFIADNPTVNMSVETVLSDLSSNIIAPNTGDPQLLRLYQKGKSINKDMGSDLLPRLKLLKQERIKDIVLFVEQLNYQLSKEYEQEVSRGIEAGIYHKVDKKETE